MDTTIADLMRRNRLAVFNGPDAERRNAAIALTYAEDAVRHEPDRVNRGRETLAWRAADLFAQSPDWVMRPDGPVSVNDDLGQARLPPRPRRLAAPRDRNGHRPRQGRRNHRALHLRRRDESPLVARGPTRMDHANSRPSSCHGVCPSPPSQGRGPDDGFVDGHVGRPSNGVEDRFADRGGERDARLPLHRVPD
ncbi:hypothetical protein ACFQ1I_45960 [Kitasatospora arboriphila]